jgi:plasmid stabilization system protein ParE
LAGTIRQAAIRFGDYLIDRAESLSSLPELGMLYRKRANVRRLLCKSYYIYYRVRRNEQTIEIMDYWHAARREPPFWKMRQPERFPYNIQSPTSDHVTRV